MIFITTGGISEGKYDIVKNSLDKINVKVIFDKVLINQGNQQHLESLIIKNFFSVYQEIIASFYVNVKLFSIYINKFYGTDIVRINHRIFKK